MGNVLTEWIDHGWQDIYYVQYIRDGNDGLFNLCDI